MKLKMYSIYDRAVCVYLTPFPARGDIDALRQIKASFKDPSMADTPVIKNPSDFTLVRLGEFDDETGVLTPQRDAFTVASVFDLLMESRSADPNQG